MRYTEYHAGKAVIKDRQLLPGAMEKLAAYENTGLTPEQIRELKERDTARAVQKAEEQPYFRKHFHSYTCPVCHKKVEPRWSFCGYCGQKIKEED